MSDGYFHSWVENNSLKKISLEKRYNYLKNLLANDKNSLELLITIG